MRKLLCVAMVVFVATAASASITGVTGMMNSSLAIPSDLTNGAFEDDQNVFVFAEQQGVVLADDLMVDITADGTYAFVSDLTPGTIAANTVVNSYLIHVDRTDNGPTSFNGGVSFDGTILGVIVMDGTLDNSDALVGNPATTYAGALKYRGLELNGQDDVFVSISGSQLSANFGVYGVMDEIRVIEATNIPTVPAPAALLLGSLGTGLVGWLRRRHSL